jgi:hypothetical protein
VNEIKKLKDQNDIWRHGEENVERVQIDYYSGLFTTSDPSNIEETVQVVRGKLREDHKEWCNGDFTREEILEAINQMHPLKAPGPDGLPALFFQKYWGIIGEDVQCLIVNILNNNRPPDNINKTFLTLIPKNKIPQLLKTIDP